ncbi:MAG: DUF2339 domain-containing protein [Nitrospirota bacterium]
MKCPQCFRSIEHLSRVCVCGYTYDEEIYNKLSVYFELRDELSNLRSIKDHFVSGVDSIALKMRRYEEVLNADIESLSVTLPEHFHETGTAEELPSAGTVSREYNVEGEISLDNTEQAKAARQEPEKKGVLGNMLKKREGGGSSQFEINLGQKWLLIIGIVTMVFGIGYFLKYSFEMGWVGPAGRVALAYIWGTVFLTAGDRFRKKNFETFGLYVIGGGIATLYFSTFAAFQLYQLFSQAPSFFVMVLITVLSGILAIIYDAKWLAILGLIGGFLTPVMLSTGQDNQIFLMSYMTVLNLGLLGIAFYKKWDILNILGFIFTYLLYTGWFFNHYVESKFWPAIIFLNLFYLIYSIIPFAYQLSMKYKESLRGFLIMTPNSFAAFGYSYFMIKEHFSLEWVSVITILYSLVFLSMASYLYKKDLQERDAFVMFLAKAALFLIITVPVIFSGHWITIFWAAQAVVLLWAGARLDRKSIALGSYILLGLSISKFLYYDYPMIFEFSFSALSISASYRYLLTERYITTIFLVLTIYGFSRLARGASLKYLSDSMSISPVVDDASICYGLCCIMLFISLNVEISSFFHDKLPGARFAAISVLWTLFSVLLMVKGFKDNVSYIRKISLGLFFITLGKVFLFDMSKIHTPYRILSFVILGIVLIGTSYLYHRFKDKIINTFASDNREELN